ncbi:hypothetical protein RJ639_003142 [Escallonia herrerae]|uniref:SAM-dependent MTase RsmB/NOP-type domain-containing protein n=1 Tax=Escallonia herrerae TaxID=1293975 RepID=A0AA88W4Z4_9ASTE|nr:hypothetical protein RJ639_003142 [Escallonia herrerae]
MVEKAAFSRIGPFDGCDIDSSNGEEDGALMGSSPVCSNTALDPLKAGVQSGPISKCQLPGLDYVVFVRGSGPHSIDYKHTEDKPLKEVIVSRKCAEAVLRGAQQLYSINGVLACSAHVEKGDVVAVSVAVEQAGLDGGWGTGITHPHFYERNGLYIGQGTTMMSRAGMFRVLEGVAVDMSNRVFTLASFNDVLEGEIFLQNLPSIITAHALDPQQGERILDMCAAPGGKTTAIAMLMKDKGEVVAVDRSHNKVLDIQKLAAEMGLNCITTCKLDALKAVRQKTEPNGRTSVSSIEAVGSTSQNSGLLNFETKRSSSVAAEALETNTTSENICKYLESLESLKSHAKYQKRMFDQAVQLVRSGGVIVYSTIVSLGTSSRREIDLRLGAGFRKPAGITNSIGCRAKRRNNRRFNSAISLIGDSAVSSISTLFSRNFLVVVQFVFQQALSLPAGSVTTNNGGTVDVSKPRMNRTLNKNDKRKSRLPFTCIFHLKRSLG